MIFQENGMFGAKNQGGDVIIQPQYMEMQPFSCGLSLVRNHQYQYAYIDVLNRKIVPFGKYSWCDPQFTCGYARVMKYHYLEEKKRWGIIDTLGNIAVPLKYDKIWTINEEYLFSLRAFIGDKEERINLHQLGKSTLFSTKVVPKRTISKAAYRKTSFWDYESEKMNDTDDWSDPYGDEQAYYGGWSREDVESGLADAYEGDIDARWNTD